MLGFYFFFLRQPASPASDFILFSLALVWGALFLITVRNSRQPYIFHSIYSVGRMGGWVAGWLVWSSNVHKVHTNSRPFRLLGFFSDCFFFRIFFMLCVLAVLPLLQEEKYCRTMFRDELDVCWFNCDDRNT